MNASFIRWLAGDWDLLVSELTEWLDGREATANEATLIVMVTQVRRARGESMPARDGQPDSDDPWEQHGKDLLDALRLELSGDVTAGARNAAASAQRMFGEAEMFEDFEVLWAPVVELQLRAGDLDAAERVLAMAGPLLGGRSRALTRAEHARLPGHDHCRPRPGS